MLREKTLAYLDGLCHASAMIWTEGGLYFHFTAYRNSATVHAPDEWRNAFHERGGVEFTEPTETQLRDLARFLRGALGDRNDCVSISRQIDIARQFLRMLREDFAYDFLQIVVEDDTYGMDANVIVASKATNDMLNLEMSWTID